MRAGQHLMHAVAELRARGYRVRAKIVGRGRLERRLRQVADRLDLSVDFHVDIPWSELPGRYREMDLFAMPCRNRWLGLEQAIHRLTAQPARFLGLTERGVVRPGAAADLTIFDLEALALEAPELRCDLPGGGARLYQAARGYRATIVGGEISLLDDEPLSGVASGRVVRARARG